MAGLKRWGGKHDKCKVIPVPKKQADNDPQPIGAGEFCIAASRRIIVHDINEALHPHQQKAVKRYLSK